MKVIDFILAAAVGLLLAAVVNNLMGCSFNQTIANQRNYEVVAKASEGSSNWIEIPVSAEVSSETESTQDTESKVTPDALSTVTGAVGKLLVP